MYTSEWNLLFTLPLTKEMLVYYVKDLFKGKQVTFKCKQVLRSA